MKLMNPNGVMVRNEIDGLARASDDQSFLASLSLMIAGSSGRGKLETMELSLLQESLRRFKVTCEEAYDAFWKAHSDPYVGNNTIAFRHLWKHIEKQRGLDSTSYTYEEMLNKMDKDKIPQSCFVMIDEKDAQDRKKWILK